MQQITIIGNLGSDAEFKAENKMLKLNVAVSEKYIKDGQQVNNTTWYSCAKFQTDATPPKILDYLKKGAKVLVQGKPSIVEVNGKAYMNVRVERFEIVAFAPKADGNATSYKAPQPVPQSQPAVIANPFSDGSNDLPF
jgi:single-strand DNA-binding protein